MPSTPKTSRMHPTHHQKSAGSGQIAQPRTATKPGEYHPTAHPRAAEIDALPHPKTPHGVGNGVENTKTWTR